MYSAMHFSIYSQLQLSTWQPVFLHNIFVPEPQSGTTTSKCQSGLHYIIIHHFYTSPYRFSKTKIDACACVFVYVSVCEDPEAL